MSTQDDASGLIDFRLVSRSVYIGCAGAALLAGAWSVVAMMVGAWTHAFLFFCFATLFRIAAGAIMNCMGDADAVNAWNNRYHRRIVIAFNAGVGGALLTALWYHRWDYGEFWGNQYGHLGTRWFLTVAVVLYFIAARFTRPNTFGARVRSAALTVALLGTMAYLAYPQYWGMYLLGGVIVWNFVWFRLRELQHRFSWKTR